MTTLIELRDLPGTGPMMLRAALSRKPGLREGETVPRFEARIDGVSITQLRAYQAICGFPSSVQVPITMPQVIAAPLHMAVLTHPDFPLPAMGLVHVASQITAERSLLEHESLSIEVWVEGERPARRGVEIDLMTAVSVNKQVIWQSTTTCLSMAGTGHGQRSASPEPPSPDPTRSSVWSLPAGLGRAYGTIAGDRNPIHLWPITAKLFGFKRHIIHGMWLLGRAIAELDEDVPEGRVRVDVAFKRPVFLPGRAHFTSGPHDGGVAFRLDNEALSKNHLFGRVEAL